MLIYQSRANLHVKTLLGKIIHLSDPKIWKILVRGLHVNENSMFISAPSFTCHLNINSILLSVSEMEFELQ